MNDDPEQRGFDPDDYRATTRMKGGSMNFKLVKPGTLKVGDIVCWKNTRSPIASIGPWTHPDLTDEYVLIKLVNGESFVHPPWKSIHVPKDQ